MKKFISDIKSLYEIKFKNIISVILISINMYVWIGVILLIFPKILINISDEFDNFLQIYSGFLTLILPVAILIIERIENKNSVMISKTYLEYTYIFPAVVYFIFNLFMWALKNIGWLEINTIYLIIISFISTLLIICVYYRSFKIISDLLCEESQINKTRRSEFSHYLEKNFEYKLEKLPSNYNTYGISTDNYENSFENDYKKVPLHPPTDNLLMKHYDYAILDKISSELKKVNSEYIASLEVATEKVKKQKNPNIVIQLSNIGRIINIHDSWATIYYHKSLEKSKILKKIIDLCEKTYITEVYDSNEYIKRVYKNIQKDCVISINQGSSVLLAENYNQYIDVYKEYIDELVLRKKNNSFFNTHAYDFLLEMKKFITDNAEMIIRTNNPRMLNPLISFLHESIRYSFEKGAIFAIKILCDRYPYLVRCSLEFENDNSAFEYLKICIFTFMDTLRYRYMKTWQDDTFDTLVKYNRVVGEIIFSLSKNKKNKECKNYCEKLFKFINFLHEEVMNVNPEYNEKNKIYYENISKLYYNYACNIYAIIAYILHNYEEQGLELISYFEEFNNNELTEVLLKTISMSYNLEFSWDLMDSSRFSDEDNAWVDNTFNYLIDLYCMIITRRTVSVLDLMPSYNLSVISRAIIKKLETMDDRAKKYIDVFKTVINEEENKEKELVRTTPVSNNIIDEFKKNFIDSYNKSNNLYMLFSETNNLKILKNKRELSKFEISNIVDKRLFLDKTSDGRNIIFNDFEVYAHSFIDAEEKEFLSLLEDKSSSKENIVGFLDGLSEYKLRKVVLFATRATIYNIFGSSAENNVYDELKMQYANLIVNVKKIKIPVVVLRGIPNGVVFQVFNNKMGTIRELSDKFLIKVGDFSQNSNLLEKTMNHPIDGLEANGIERKNKLLESAKLEIEEYIKFDIKKLECFKFIK